MSDYARAVAATCEGLGEPPILIGHSLGGLVAQLAAARAPIDSLILLAPSAPWGVHGVTLEGSGLRCQPLCAGALLEPGHRP